MKKIRIIFILNCVTNIKYHRTLTVLNAFNFPISIPFIYFISISKNCNLVLKSKINKKFLILNESI